MDIIKNWFKDNGYEVDEYETTLQAKTDTILFLVVELHNGINGKWMLKLYEQDTIDYLELLLM